MRTDPLVLAWSIVLAGCPGSHVTLEPDAAVGPDASPRDAWAVDAAPATADAFVPSRTCRLAMPAVVPDEVGVGCFCDGPFAVRGQLAYRLGFMLEVIDLHDLSHPRVVTSVAHEARYSADVAIVDSVLFAAGGALERFDLADPLAPVSLGLVDLGGDATALAVDGNRLVVSILRPDMSHAIRTIDATDPRVLILGAPIDLGTAQASALALSGDTAYAITSDLVTGAGSLLSLDLAVGRLEDTLPQPSGGLLGSMALSAGRLFVSQLGSGVQLVDVSDPRALVDLGQIPIAPTSVFALALDGDRLIVLGGGISLYDVRDPRVPVALGHADWASDLAHAALTPDHLLASGGNGLVSFPLACP